MAKRRIPNSSISDMLTGKSGIDVLKDLSDNRSIGKIDYVGMQLSQPSLVFKELITDEEKLMIMDRHETFDTALWSEGDVRLTKIFTSSLQSPETKIYYRDVYKSEDTDLGPEFTISYGDYYGYGSSTGSFGNIPTEVYESKAIYSKYQNLLLGSDKELFKFKFPSWQKPFDSLSRVFSAGKSLNASLTSYNKDPQYYFMSNFPVSNWKSVSTGYTFTTALKEDGTLWAWGSGGNGVLGNGLNEDSGIPVQIGTDTNWIFHTSGPFHSIAIKSDGSMWTWGKGADFRLGTNSTQNESIPVKITAPFPKKWKYASAGQGHSLAIDTDGKLWGWGYNTSGQLGTGDNDTKQTPVQIGTSTNWIKVYAGVNPTGDCFSLALNADGELYGMGYNDRYELGLDDRVNRNVPTRIGTETYVEAAAGDSHAFAINTDGTLWRWGTFFGYGYQSGVPKSQPEKFNEAGNGWVDIKTSIFSAIGLKNNGYLYSWGQNEFGALGLGSSVLGQTIPAFVLMNPILEEDKKSDRNIISFATSDYADWNESISDYNKFSGFSMMISKYGFTKNEYEESDFIYVINLNRNRFKDSIKPGTWQLSLLGIDDNNLPLTGSVPITLIDDSSLSNYDVDKKDVYNIYSGSLTEGFYTQSVSAPYGLFYPNHGIIVLNGRSLYSFNSVLTKRLPPDSNSISEYNSNADTLFNSVSSSMAFDSSLYYFQGTSSERIESSYIFVRIKSDEFNYTNNPTYVSQPNGIIKPKYRNNDFGLTYITTIGLYDDEENLVAVAKLSKPIRKTIEKEMVIKIRIRY